MNTNDIIRYMDCETENCDGGFEPIPPEPSERYVARRTTPISEGNFKKEVYKCSGVGKHDNVIYWEERKETPINQDVPSNIADVDEARRKNIQDVITNAVYVGPPGMTYQLGRSM
jgi:hypothetical protein